MIIVVLNVSIHFQATKVFIYFVNLVTDICLVVAMNTKVKGLTF